MIALFPPCNSNTTSFFIGHILQQHILCCSYSTLSLWSLLRAHLCTEVYLADAIRVSYQEDVLIEEIHLLVGSAGQTEMNCLSKMKG